MSSISTASLMGKVFTFYSYKGGVGRSMALVNVGVLLALSGKRVLLIDWDLEAPGLEVYFRNTAKLEGDPERVPGIVDLLEAKMAGTTLDWHDCRLKALFLGHSLDIISAGSRTSEYRKRVQKLDWEALFSEHRIGNYVSDLREQWRSEYDFVLVDSRTGITDIGDICTVLLPDVLVLLFISNYQNLEGIKNVIGRAVAARNKLPVNRNKLISVPIPSRDEAYNEYEKASEWKQIYARELGEFYQEWLPKEVSPTDALSKLFIPYVTIWSFGERIPVLESTREIQDPTTIGAAYKRLANLIANDLDWYATEGKTVEDLQGTQIELHRWREEVSVLAQEVTAAKRVRLRYLVVVMITTAVIAGISVVSYYKAGQRPVDGSLADESSVSQKHEAPTSTELFEGRGLLAAGKVTEAMAVFEARRVLLTGLLGRNPEDFALLRSLGDTYLSIGEAQEKQGRLPEAMAAYAAYKSVHEAILKKAPSQLGSQLELSFGHHKIGGILEVQWKLDEALAAYQQDLSISERLASVAPSNKEWQRNLALTYNAIGRILQAQGKLEDALVAFRKAQTIVDQLTASDPSYEVWQSEKAVTYSNVGAIREAQGKLEDALAAYQQEKSIVEKLAASSPSDKERQRELVSVNSRISRVHEVQGELEEALNSSQRRKDIVQKVATDSPSNKTFQDDLARSHSVLGGLLIKKGQYSKAEAELIQAKNIFDSMISESPSNFDFQESLFYVYKRFGLMEQARAKQDKATAWLGKAEDLLASMLRASPASSQWRKDLMSVQRLKSGVLLASGHGKEALESIEQSMNLYQATKVEKGADFFWNREYALDLVQLGHVWFSMKEVVRASQAYDKAQQILDRLIRISPRDVELIQARQEVLKIRKGLNARHS